jgi:hypothetical protein
MTTRPIYVEKQHKDSDVYDRIRRIDEYWLPSLYIPLLLFSLISGIGVFLFDDVQWLLGIPIYIILEIVTFLTVGKVYGSEYEDAMGTLRTTSRNRVITASRGWGSESGDLFITNDSDEVIDEEDVRFLVAAPEGVEVDIPDAFPSPDPVSDEWIYSKSIDPGEQKRVAVQISIDSMAAEEISDPKVTVIARQDGEVVGEETYVVE